MPSRRPWSRRFVLSLVLAAVLAGEITGLALARTLTPATTVVPAASVGSGAAAADSSSPATGRSAGPFDGGHSDASIAASHAGRRAITDDGLAARTTKPTRSAGVAIAAPRPKSTSSTHAPNASYRGTNHVWIPSLGINRSVQSFPCSRNRPPDAGVYRWGCAGRNNVYLLSHAWSTFEPLHDAYSGGRLRKGMQVVYADGSSHVHTYSVIWWRVVAPTTAASWAWASLGTPSMTLQTCVGANSQYRLMVRLVRIR